MIRQELGSLSPLVQRQVDEVLEGGIDTDDTDGLQDRLLAMDAADSDRGAMLNRAREELEAGRRLETLQQQQQDELRRLLAKSHDWLGFAEAPFRSQGFLHHELGRTCVLASRDPQAKLVMLGRLSLFGQGATRLHDALIGVIAHWHPGADRAAVLKPHWMCRPWICRRSPARSADNWQLIGSTGSGAWTRSKSSWPPNPGESGRAGEGIFIEFEPATVRAWAASDPVVLRAGQFTQAFKNEWLVCRGLDDDQFPFPGVPYLLLHSLSHLLITEMALECGYGASSIRERKLSGEGLRARAALRSRPGESHRGRQPRGG